MSKRAFNKIAEGLREAIELACAGPLSDEEIQDFTKHDFKARGCTGCQPGTCGQSCSSCTPSCGRSGVRAIKDGG